MGLFCFCLLASLMTTTHSFDQTAFDASFEAALSKCRELTRAEAEHFMGNGYVVIRDAFPKEIAAAECRRAWSHLAEEYGVDEHEPSSWNRSFNGRKGRRGYVRTPGSSTQFLLKTEAPRAFQTQADFVGGADRLPHNGDQLALGDGCVGNLGVPDQPWQPPTARMRGWHKDGWHFRHFLNSPEMGLLTLTIFSDILPKSGGTFIATDSVGVVARFLADHPEGVHADGTQVGYLIPGLVEQCSQFAELTGEAGDMVLCHPYMLHCASPNPSPRSRFISNGALVLKAPMQFDRAEGDPYSLVELSVLRALGTNRLPFKNTRPLAAIKPRPHRNDEEAEKEQRQLEEEMRAMARAGTLTPEWAPEFGYMSNRALAS